MWYIGHGHVAEQTRQVGHDGQGRYFSTARRRAVSCESNDGEENLGWPEEEPGISPEPEPTATQRGREEMCVCV